METHGTFKYAVKKLTFFTRIIKNEALSKLHPTSAGGANLLSHRPRRRRKVETSYLKDNLIPFPGRVGSHEGWGCGDRKVYLNRWDLKKEWILSNAFCPSVMEDSGQGRKRYAVDGVGNF